MLPLHIKHMLSEWTVAFNMSQRVC